MIQLCRLSALARVLPLLPAVIGLALLSGCAGDSMGGDDVSATGGPEPACVQRCDRAFAVCDDKLAAQREGNPLFGAGAQCRRDYDSCLRRCPAPT